MASFARPDTLFTANLGLMLKSIGGRLQTSILGAREWTTQGVESPGHFVAYL